MRIAYLADPTSVNGLYRGVVPMTALERLRGHEVRRLFTPEAQPREAPLGDIDVLYMHRYCDARARRLAAAAKRSRAAVIWDNDDDMGAMPRSFPTYKHFGGRRWEQRLEQMRRLFRSTDLVTAPSPVLTARLADWGAPATATTENYLADDWLPARDVRPPRKGATIIGWVGGGEHAIDAQEIPIVDALQRILDERPDVGVVSVGVRLALREDRYRHIGRIAPRNLSRQNAVFDLAIAPLADIPFNGARSNVKLKEYAAAGTPWLASPIGPYADMGEQQGGRLVPDDRWYEAITRLLDRPRERRKLAKRGARWAAGQTIAKNIAIWEERFATAAELSRRGRLRAPRSAA